MNLGVLDFWSPFDVILAETSQPVNSWKERVFFADMFLISQSHALTFERPPVFRHERQIKNEAKDESKTKTRGSDGIARSFD